MEKWRLNAIKYSIATYRELENGERGIWLPYHNFIQAGGPPARHRVFANFPDKHRAFLRAIGSKRTGPSTTSVRLLEMQSPVPSMFSATLDFHLVDEQPNTGKLANPDHYAVLYIDKKPVPKAHYKMAMSALQWPSL
ncbi:hypothetical protein FIBSPDRAFT_905998 [Athelia psychrophila]|uniref:Uncharacterized protein n=1 Tax=Athelia psychrophila TaxID=1759441 RepID=A0A167SVB5_9AGAM|nr:hypothetical protein FIBSPDRAFT_905998 [Fibularhizoctonia sp. CBS 109695]